MRRRTNPKAVLLMIIITVAAVILAILVRNMLPEGLMKWRSLIFWGIIAVGAGLGGFLCGKFLNRR